MWSTQCTCAIEYSRVWSIEAWLNLERRISLALKDRKNSRFVLSTDDEAEKATKGVISKNTTRVNSWPTNFFYQWASARKEADKENVPSNVLYSNDPGLLCQWLCRFELEVRQESGKQYPPKTMLNLLAGLYRVVRDEGIEMNFLEKRMIDLGPCIRHFILSAVSFTLRVSKC